MKKILFILLCILAGAQTIKAETVYDLYIAGTRVTSDNQNDILGDGAFSYDPSTKTLSLKKDYAIDSNSDKNVIWNSGTDGLVIDVTKDVTLTSAKDGVINVKKNTTIKGSGTLTLRNAEVSSPYARVGLFIAEASTMTLDHVTVISECVSGGVYGISGNLIVKGASMKISNVTSSNMSAIQHLTSLTLTSCSIVEPEGGYFDETQGSVVDKDGNKAKNVIILANDARYYLYVAGTRVTELNKNDILGDGAFSYDPSTKTLSLKKDYTIDTNSEEKIVWNSGIDDLVIDVTKDVTLTSGKVDVINVKKNTTIKGSGTLTLRNAEVSSPYARVGLFIAEASTMTLDHVTVISECVSGGVYGISGNLIVKGASMKISNVTSSNMGAIQHLTSLTLTSCSIVEPEGGYFDETQGVVVDKDGNKAKNVTILANDARYYLYVAGTRVTELNKNDILGDGAFSYDPSTKTLSLKKDYTIDTNSEEKIVWNSGIDDLVIDVTKDVTLTSAKKDIINVNNNTTIKGSGTLTLRNVNVSSPYARVGLYIANASTMTLDHVTIISECTSGGILGSSGNLIVNGASMKISNVETNGYAINKLTSMTLTSCLIVEPDEGKFDETQGSVVDKDGNKARDVVIAANGGDWWNLYVAGKRVHKFNWDDVLGDGKVSFDPASKTLKLDGANINFSDGYGIRSQITDLKVKLLGKNTITTTGNFAGARFQISKVTFIGGGSLEIKSSATGFMTYVDVEIKEGTKLSIESLGDYNAFQGRYLSSDNRVYPTLIMSGAGTELRAKGGLTGSVAGVHALDLSDGIVLAEPVGATLVEDIGVVIDGGMVANEWVVFKKELNYDLNGDGKVSAGDIQIIINEMKKPVANQNMMYDLNGDGKISAGDIQIIINEMKK